MPKLPKLPRLSSIMPRAPLKRITEDIKEGLQDATQMVRDAEGEVREVTSSLRVPGAEKPEQAQIIGGVTDEATLRYQLDRLIDDLQHLETEHLPAQGKIEGEVCDCIAKAARDARRHAMETIPIASRQGKEAEVYSEIASWAQHLIDIGDLESVKSGRYDDEYLEQAGTASKFRKELERLWRELKPKSFQETCEECPSIEEIGKWLEKRKAEKAD